MSENLESAIKELIKNKITEPNRPDLFRSPIVGFSSAHDSRYAELKSTVGSWHLNPTEILPQAESVISYFVPFTRDVIAGPKNADYSSEIWSEAYLIINECFGETGKALSEMLVQWGYLAETIPATHTFDPATIECKWSHRSAACIAGMGSFGANRMLITSRGSGGRFCSVITSARLTPGKEPAEERCLYNKSKSCGRCFEVCPANTLSGGSFDKFACQAQTQRNREYMRENSIQPESDTCGKCISVCPVAYIK